MAEDGRIVELFNAHGLVDELEIDEDFQLHQADASRQYPKHRVTGTEVLEAHGNAPRFFDNAGPGRRAPLVMVGPTSAGRMLTVPLEPAGHNGLWRPVSAYESNAKDIERYREEAADG